MSTIPPTSGVCLATSLFTSTNDMQQLTYINLATGATTGTAMFSVIQVIPPPSSGTDNYPEQYQVYISTNFTIPYSINGVAWSNSTVRKFMLLSVEPVGPPPPEGAAPIEYTATILTQNSGTNIAQVISVILSVYTSQGQVYADITSSFEVVQ